MFHEKYKVIIITLVWDYNIKSMLFSVLQL